MVLTPSTMMPLGSSAPDFSLPDTVTGKEVKLTDFSDKKALLVIFICRHCPYVQHVKGELAKLGKDYKDKNLGMVTISSNDPESYPEDKPESLKEMAVKNGFDFPLLYDESQETAKKYKAACTPDPYLFDKDRKLVYRGQLDDSRPGNGLPVTGKDIRVAIEAVLKDQPVSDKQRPSVGCSIKWKPGNEPDYLTS